MKIAFLNLSIVLICGINAFAQQSQVPGNSTEPGKTTALASRLVGHSIYGNYILPIPGWGLLDSTHFTYSPYHGYDTAVGEWEFDTDSVVGYVGTPSFKVIARQTQTFASNNHIAMQFHESADGAGNWSSDEWHRYTWNTDSTMAVHEYAKHISGWDSVRLTYTYNTSGKAILEYKEVKGVNSWRNAAKTFTTYNIDGTQAGTVQLIWDVSTSSWDSTRRVINTYNGAGLLTKKLFQSYSVNHWVTDQDQNYTYDSKGNLTQHETLDLFNSSAYKYNYTYDANNDLIWEDKSSYGGIIKNYTNEYRNIYTYNNFHQVLTTEYWAWDLATAQYNKLNNIDYYYYESYDDGVVVGVKNMIEPDVIATLFPVPASNELHVKLNGSSEADIMLFDLRGRLVKYTTIPSGNTIQRIDVSNLSAGTYIFKALINGKTSVRNISLIK